MLRVVTDCAYPEALALPVRDALKVPGTPEIEDNYIVGLIGDVPAAGVPLEDCFFTNFFMGLVKGSISTGAFPGANDAEFVARCRAFFVEQLKALQPRVVIVLGVQTPRHLAAVAPELARWERVRTFKHLDESGAALVKAAHVPGVDAAFSAVVVAHPSLGFANRRHRKFNGLIGDGAEAALIAAALA